MAPHEVFPSSPTGVCLVWFGLVDEPKYQNFLERHLWWAASSTSILLLGGFEHATIRLRRHDANLSASWLDATKCDLYEL